MEIGEEGVCAAERPWGVDEDAGGAAVRGDRSVGGGAVFEDPGDGGADGDAALGGFDGGGGFRRDLVLFRVHDVVRDDIRFDWLECAGSDVQSNARVRERSEDFRCEVEACGGSGDRVRAVPAGIDRLVAFLVLVVIAAVHVVREGKVTVLLIVRWLFEMQVAGAVFRYGRDGAGAAADGDAVSLAHALAGTDHADPVVRGDCVEAEDFDAAVVREEAGAGHADIIEDDEVGGVYERGEITERAVFPAVFRAVHDQHAGGIALGERSAGDEFVGQVVIEVFGAEHVRFGEKSVPSRRGVSWAGSLGW